MDFKDADQKHLSALGPALAAMEGSGDVAGFRTN